jgi:hypothetical protein
VAAAVYLSKKRINMAGLSIGVVRWGGVEAASCGRKELKEVRSTLAIAHRCRRLLLLLLFACLTTASPFFTLWTLHNTHAAHPAGLPASAEHVCQLWVRVAPSGQGAVQRLLPPQFQL